MDSDQDLDLDEEELAIQKFIRTPLVFPKDELLKEEPPQIITQEDEKKRADEAL